MIRVGVIGCGKIAQVRHFPEYERNPNAEIYGVFDIDRERACKMAGKYSAKVYDSYEELLGDKNIEAVSICTANFSHCQITIEALKAGKHVLCEKPMAISYEECRKMVETAKETGKFLMIGHNQRFTDTHREARKLILEGEIGRIISFKSSFGHSGPENWAIDNKNVWFFDKRTAAFGAMADLGIHKTDLVQFLTGSKVEEVVSVVSTLDKKNPDGSLIGVDDNAFCIYKMENGVVGTVTVSWTLYGEEDNCTILYGTDGCMKIYHDPQYSIVVEKGHGRRILYEIDKIQTNENQSNSGVIDEWIYCLETNTPPKVDGEEAFSAMKAVFAALLSSKEGRNIKVREIYP